MQLVGGAVGPGARASIRPVVPVEANRACWDSSGVYHGCDQMDHGSEALIGLAGAHCDTFELLEHAEEVLNEMPPFASPRRWREVLRNADAGRSRPWRRVRRGRR